MKKYILSFMIVATVSFGMGIIFDSLIPYMSRDGTGPLGCSLLSSRQVPGSQNMLYEYELVVNSAPAIQDQTRAIIYLTTDQDGQATKGGMQFPEEGFNRDVYSIEFIDRNPFMTFRTNSGEWMIADRNGDRRMDIIWRLTEIPGASEKKYGLIPVDGRWIAGTQIDKHHLKTDDNQYMLENGTWTLVSDENQ